MKWIVPASLLAIVFSSCTKEDSLQQVITSGRTNSTQLSELIFYSDSSFSGTGTDSVAYSVQYNGSAIAKLIKVRQYPAAGGVNLYENLADSILFTYSGSQLSQRDVYKSGSLAKRNTYSYSGSNLVQDNEQGFSGGYTGATNYTYTGANHYYELGIFTNSFKDSIYYNYNGSGDLSSAYGYYNYGTGYTPYGFTLNYTTQANALRTLVNNDVLLSVILGTSPAIQPSASIPDTLMVAYGGAVNYKRKVVQQLHSSGYIQRMINYFHKPYMRLANTANKLLYVQLKYDNL